MEYLGNVSIGFVFEYNGGLFVVMPFDWEDNKYYNLCIATRNRDEYDVGEKYFFDHEVQVQVIPTAKLKEFIPK
jgi:hypothetical protein